MIDGSHFFSFISLTKCVGGRMPGTSYQYCCNSKPWKAMGLAMILVPEIYNLWNYPPTLEYIESIELPFYFFFFLTDLVEFIGWVAHGAWG